MDECDRFKRILGKKFGEVYIGGYTAGDGHCMLNVKGDPYGQEGSHAEFDKGVMVDSDTVAQGKLSLKRAKRLVKKAASSCHVYEVHPHGYRNVDMSHIHLERCAFAEYVRLLEKLGY